jgi:hypothetical protein
MTTEELEATVTVLQESVSTLENTMQMLITNLASNNSMYLNALDALAQNNNTEEARTSAVADARAGICTSNPPGCNV